MRIFIKLQVLIMLFVLWIILFYVCLIVLFDLDATLQYRANLFVYLCTSVQTFSSFYAALSLSKQQSIV